MPVLRYSQPSIGESLMGFCVQLSLNTMTGFRELLGLPTLKRFHQGSQIPLHFVRLVRPQVLLATWKLWSAFN